MLIPAFNPRSAAVSTSPRNAALVLSYADPRSLIYQPPLWLRITSVLLSSAAIAVIFVPFAAGGSPFGVLIDWTEDQDFFGLMPLAIPFFLALPIAAVAFRSLITTRVSGPEQVCAWVFAGGAAADTVRYQLREILALLQEQGRGRLDLIAILTGLLILILGAGAIGVLRRSLNTNNSHLLALYGAYAGHGVMCLILFNPFKWDGPCPGWCLTIPIVGFMTADLVFVLRRSGWRFARSRTTAALNAHLHDYRDHEE